MRFPAALAAFLAVSACGGSETTPASDRNESAAEASISGDRYVATDATTPQINSIAEDFVKLSLGLGQYDKAFVDAYHGPSAWADEAAANPPSLSALATEAAGLLISLQNLNAVEPTPRSVMLERLVRAADTRIKMAAGETFSFDEETRLLYDAVAPQYALAAFDEALEKIDALLPGDAPLNERVDAFRNGLAIPEDKLQVVFDRAIDECKTRTLQHYTLPDTERFSLEFVKDKPWSGYNWYQGDFDSLIQVNTDFPIVIDRAIDLGCHEGYPGHHTWNVILERDILNSEGWVEYSLYPLFSPLSLIAEGTANYGIDLAFPGEEKITFERDVLFPLAGLDPDKAGTLAALNEAMRALSHARNHIAREYLDGRIDREEAINLVMRYRLESRARAEQTLDFIETYRGYVINYNLGLDLVDAYIEREVADGGEPWAVFEKLLRAPPSASDLSASK